MISTSPVAVPAGKAGDENEAENEDEGGSSSEEEELPGEARATWGNQCELFLSCLGMSMGLGSFWRMPSLVRANGGVAFLVSYVVVSLTVAKPVFFMELFLGQFSSQGSVGVWRCAPIGRGIGICMCYVSLLISTYFVCFTAHAMLFVWKSLGDRLPWATCDEEWGADAACFVRQRGKVPCKDVTWWLAEHYAHANLTDGHEVSYEDLVFYVPDDVYKNKSDGCQYGTNTAAEQFYFRHILGLSESVSMSGNFRIDILVCIGICWIVFYLIASRGIRLSRKVVYVTSLVSYALLSVLLLRGLVRLPGADFGIHYMLKPEWSKLLNIRVWYEAMRHSLLSGGVSTGVIINVGSFNQFSSGTYTVVAGVALAEVLLGLVSGAVVFSVLGSLSERLDTPIEDLARHGMSLFFLSFTEAVADIDFAYVWSAGFFSAFVLCALDSNSLMVESVLTPLSDEFTCVRARRPRTAFAYSLIAFFASMPLAMQNGVYLAFLLDTYVRGMLIPIIAFVEICVIVIFYGVTRLGLDYEFATGRRQCCYLDLCLRVFAPGALCFTMLFSLFGKQRDLYFENYKYPVAAKMIGWCVAAFGLLQIPLFAYAELYAAHFASHFSTTTTLGKSTGDAVPKRAAKAGGVRIALPEDGAPDEDSKRDARAFRKAAIRRMSMATGRTPNELKRMEVLLKLRRSTMSESAISDATELESKPKIRPFEPPDTAEREPTPASTAKQVRRGSLSQDSLGFAVPPHAQGASGSAIGAATSPGATREGRDGHADGHAKRRAKGHITISSPAGESEGSVKKTASPHARRLSTVLGPPVLGYSDVLRRPSIKVTLLESVADSGPEMEKQAAEQVKRAVRDFRRKSIAAARTLSAAGLPGAASSRMSISGGPGFGFQPLGGPPRRSVSEEYLPPGSALSRPSISASPYMAAPRRSVSRGSVAYGPLPPRRSSSAGPSPGGFHPELGVPRVSVSGGFPAQPLATPRGSVGGGPASVPPFDRRSSTRPSVSGASSPPGDSRSPFSPEELARLRAIAHMSALSSPDNE
ncbi:sodium- and chloride-dependent glycine transporter 1-like isoform X2 [Dermacentor variabilis]|uniref:sodium- and chloride-dependent glycine transporter 1-like isoform X2 n=1 Tax=Dermacentor variabilis TaxID=34621 RepID=UPI003F5AE7DA